MSEEEQLLADLKNKSQKGDLEATYELGWRSAIGIGLPLNEALAINCLHQAARAGHALAQNNLGARYLAGEGVPADPLQAYYWFSRAAAQGDRKAGKNRDSVAAQLSPEQLQQAQQMLTASASPK